jgi:hypothetical protein
MTATVEMVFHGMVSLRNPSEVSPTDHAVAGAGVLIRLANGMSDKVAKVAASAARRAQRVYFPNRVIQFMSNQEKKVVRKSCDLASSWCDM